MAEHYYRHDLELPAGRAVRAEIAGSFGDEQLPTGLRAVIGRRDP
jgi:hypothetical protein